MLLLLGISGSLFRCFRLAKASLTDTAKRYKKVANATAVIWKMLLLAEQRFRSLDAPDKIKLVYPGIDLQEVLEANREEMLAVA